MYEILQYIFQLFSPKKLESDTNPDGTNEENYDIEPLEDLEGFLEYDPDTTLILERDYPMWDHSTTGKIVFPDGTTMDSLELPWLNNEVRVSCIPFGLYEVKKRHSHLITRLTRNMHTPYTEGYEVMNVENRSNILFHQANRVSELLGCIAMGTAAFENGVPVVWSSYKAFHTFMTKMDSLNITHVLIKKKGE